MKSRMEMFFETADMRSAVEGFFYAAARGGAEHPTACLQMWQANKEFSTPEHVRQTIVSSWESLPKETSKFNPPRQAVSFTYPGGPMAGYTSVLDTEMSIGVRRDNDGHLWAVIVLEGHDDSVSRRRAAIPDAVLSRMAYDMWGWESQCQEHCRHCTEEKAKREAAARQDSPVTEETGDEIPEYTQWQ